MGWQKGQSGNPDTKWKAGQPGNRGGAFPRVSMALVRDAIAEQLVRRKSEREIAESESIVSLYGRPRSVRWVRKQIRAIEEQWKEYAVRDLAAIRSEMIATLQGVLKESWAAYLRTIGTNTVTFKEAKGGNEKTEGQSASGANQKKVSVREEQLAGSHEWMGKILQTVKQLCDLTGVEHPKRMEFTGADGGPIKTENAGGINYEQFAAAFNAFTKQLAFEHGMEAAGADGGGESLHPGAAQGDGVSVAQAGAVSDDTKS